MKTKELLKKIRNELENSEEELDVETISEKLKITKKECMDLLEYLGIDVIDEEVNDDLNESVITEDEKKKQIFGMLKKERTISYISKELNISNYEVAGIINELKNDGYNILHAIKNGEDTFLNLGNDSLKRKGIYKVDNIDKEFKFLAISDTRLCSCYQQLGILNEIYTYAFEHGASFVVHCGDISEGLHSNILFKDTIFAHDTISQSEYIIENYPYIEGMPTYFITGERDDTHITASKQNIGKIISSERDDLIYLGQRRAVLQVGNTNILVRHPKGRQAYTISYKSQRHIAALRSEDKVNIILNGHWCVMDSYERRKINQFSVPSIVAQTPEMDYNEFTNTVGAYLITVKLDEKGKFKKTTYEDIVYYETIKDEDYRRVKPLILNSDSSRYQKILTLRKETK